MGSPSLFTEELFDTICDAVASGTPLAEVCRQPGMPGLRTVYDWLDDREGLAARFARAREAMADYIAADCIRIVDDGHNNPLHAAKRADIRMKVLSKWDSRYADKVQVNHANNVGGNLRDISEGEAAARVAAILEAARRRIPLIEGGESGSD